ncbi:Cutinase transcription factor 1 alpha [Penicillium chermesinum]|nr:Cutinase transcription factor 1 alpha [Penicillium chermesinum]
MSVSQSSPPVIPGIPPAMGMRPGQQQMFGMDGQPWPVQGMDGTMSGAALDATSQDNDTWSSSSRSGPTAPTTLNVEDWYVTSLMWWFPDILTLDCRFQFFGINGGFADLAA